METFTHGRWRCLAYTPKSKLDIQADKRQASIMDVLQMSSTSNKPSSPRGANEAGDVLCSSFHTVSHYPHITPIHCRVVSVLFSIIPMMPQYTV